MSVHTTYFTALANEDVSPGPRAKVWSVVRRPQSWTSDLVDRNLPAFAPPASLLDAYKTVQSAAEENGEENASEIAWRSVQFERQYHEHLQKPELQKPIASLKSHAESFELWLVCYEASDRYCHRRLLADALEPDLGLPSSPHLDDACPEGEHDLIYPRSTPVRVCRKCGLGSYTLDCWLGHDLGGIEQ